jgi:hypothetical protein
MFSIMSNKRLIRPILVWQTSAEAYPVWCIHDCGGAGGASGRSRTCGMKCLAAQSMSMNATC